MSGVLVVTGGSSGIGLAVAQRAARTGVSISLDLVPPPTGSPVHHIHCDVRDENSVSDAARTVSGRFGCLNGLLINAGVLEQPADVARLRVGAWRDVLDTNLTGAFLTAKHFVDDLRASRGAMVLTASIVAERGSPGHLAYAAAKAGVVALTRSLAVALARDGVRVNAISPGSVVGTKLLGHSLSTADLVGLAATIPARRPATPTDIARAVEFLLSPAAVHITGEVLTVDGGERYARPGAARQHNEEVDDAGGGTR
ncbi:SDR family NAD(P)-dependent oxidoreductase [Micromonospora sp.]|uniref:SDR family NAD(P)-dependent oxidoreductase n=1 Tax=Micromonospora sp. TaxID=1876 RepID=UPI003B3A103F